MSKFKINDVWSNDQILQEVVNRSADWEIINNTTEVPGQPGIMKLGDPCSVVEWKEFAGNKLYFDDNPVDLPKTGKWKYRLPVTYNKSKNILNAPNITFPNVKSIKIEDKSRGGFRENEHYYIRSNGEVWVKGSRPYLNLAITVNWKTDLGQESTSKVNILPDDFIINGDLVSVSDKKVRVPYRPCYQGFEAIYNIYTYTVTFYRKFCIPGIYSGPNDFNEVADPYLNIFKPGTLLYEFGKIRDISNISLVDFNLYGQNTFFISSSIDIVKKEAKEYREQTRFSDLLECECVELNIITPPTVNRFLTPNCDCTVTVSEQIYIICPDKVTVKAYDEYLAGRQTPPELVDVISEDDLDVLVPTYTRIITADPCDFGDTSTRVWQRFARRDIREVVKNEIDGLFNGQESISCLSTSSIQTATSKPYYYDITDCAICDVSKSYFSVSFGHSQGSGSNFKEFEDNDSPSKSIYSQYKLKALHSFSDQFTYYSNATEYTSSMIYIMTFTSDSIKDKIDAGNFQINLSELNGLSYTNNVYTGSNVAVSSSQKILSLIDNSHDLTEIESCSDKSYIYSFDIVSGSLSNGIYLNGIGTSTSNNNFKTYGKVYPNLGVVVLSGELLNGELNFNSVTGSNINGDNPYKLFTSLSGSTALGMPTKFRNSRQRNIRNYSIRIAPVECNYSNNPTYLKEYGRIKHACFIDNPVIYITTIGLYNSARELVAIAKLSKPIKKTKDDTIDIKIRLGL